ncbi:unnamed protein product [Pleuronectes platessa]|uniref:Uncharacterized protein n=1 Tax=Pleuronectes platessa TaxID=8262 RepID=A0A9N7TQT8_PLEPL|nr:unnamed protein product [Pleuronectes platessa]
MLLHEDRARSSQPSLYLEQVQLARGDSISPTAPIPPILPSIPPSLCKAQVFNEDDTRPLLGYCDLYLGVTHCDIPARPMPLPTPFKNAADLLYYADMHSRQCQGYRHAALLRVLSLITKVPSDAGEVTVRSPPPPPIILLTFGAMRLVRHGRVSCRGDDPFHAARSPQNGFFFSQTII